MMRGAGKPKANGAKARKGRDEDLILFREMFKREKERNVNLLEPVSSEFESSQGSFPLYKLPSGKKGYGNDFLGAEKEKNDYDWLKTPPATPLFPSLEMEANDPNIVLQRELPILQHIKPSRFSAKIEAAKPEERPKSPSSSSTASASSSRSETPRTRLRPTSSSGNTPTLRAMLNLKERSNISTAFSSSKRTSTSSQVSTNANVGTRKENPRNISTPRKQNSDRKPQSRGVSPMARPRLTATLPGFPDEAPPNLITSAAVTQGRATSATRGRPVGKNTSLASTIEPKVESVKPRRQSCSPSLTRGRKVVEPAGILQKYSGSKPKVDISTGNGTLVIGSRMVEKMMNARRSAGGVDQKDGQARYRNKANEQPSIGQLMSRTSLYMAHKQMDISKNQSGLKTSAAHANASSSTGSGIKLIGYQATQGSSDGRNFRSRAGSESKLPTIRKGESRTRNFE